MIRRLQSRADFARLRRHGIRVRSGPLWCTMVVSPMIDSEQTFSDAEVAFAVPRAVGSAVVRNRLRRRLREILRSRPLGPGLYLWGAGPGAESLDFAELTRHVDRLLARGRARADAVGVS